MWEFGVRILAAGLLVAVSGWTGVVPFEVAWRVAALAASYAFLFYVLDRRSLMNPGTAGLAAGLDSLAIGAALAYSGQLGTLGFFVLAPAIYAIAKRGSFALGVGSISAAAIMCSEQLVKGGGPPSAAVLGQTLGVFLITALANQPRVVVRPRTIKEMIAEMAETPADVGAQALIELREKYRRVTTSFKELERRSRVDRIRSQLFLASTKNGDIATVLEKARVLFEASGAALYVVSKAGGHMCVSGLAGNVPKNSETLNFKISGHEAAHTLRDNAGKALAALNEEEPAVPHCNILLRWNGRVIGLLTLFAGEKPQLEEIRRHAEESADAVAHIVFEEQQSIAMRRRTLEAELLYELACRMDGAASKADLGKRTAKALAEIIRSSHVSVWSLGDLPPILLGKEGRAARLFEYYEGEPVGVSAWLADGAHAIVAPSLAESSLFSPEGIAKERLGGYILAPIRAGDEVLGFISVGANAAGALSMQDAQFIQDAAAEFARAISTTSTSTSGLLTVPEFQREVFENPADKSCIVYVEPLHFAELEQSIGTAALELASRHLGLLVKRHSPFGSKICRKSDGSLMILLVNSTLEQAQSWAAEITALAALRSYERVPGSEAVPLAVRARAADLSSKPETIQEPSEVA